MNQPKGLDVWFLLCFFTAIMDWYLATFLVLCLDKFHTTKELPHSIYNMYSGAFFDEFKQHFFYLLFVILGLLSGFLIKFLPVISSNKLKTLFLGTVIAFLLMPLAAVGVYGVSLAANWPSVAPPLQIDAGWLLCIPGFVTIILTLFRITERSRS